MSGPSFWEFLLICMIGLIVLGPKRLPQVANQLGTWIGQARRMTRTLKRQLEEELELDKPAIPPRPAVRHAPPRDDDAYSPLHKQPALTTAAATPSADAGMANAGTTAAPVTPGDEPGAATQPALPAQAASGGTAGGGAAGGGAAGGGEAGAAGTNSEERHDA